MTAPGFFVVSEIRVGRSYLPFTATLRAAVTSFVSGTKTCRVCKPQSKKQQGDSIGSIVKEDYEALLSIAQHHDYPTPLLDWTESPHIAAYFALRHREPTETRQWRIYAFNATKFIEARVMSEKAVLEAPHLFLYITRASQLDNVRARAQKSVFILSSVADIEWFADDYPVPLLLRRFDLPAEDAPQALSALRRLGITGSSLFPPDSHSSRCAEVCSDLKAKFFTSAQ